MYNYLIISILSGCISVYFLYSSHLPPLSFLGFFFSIFNSAWQADPPQNHNYSTEPSQAPAAQCSATGYISVCLMLCKHSRHPDISADNKLAQQKKTLSSVFLKAFPDSLTHSRWWPCFPLALWLNCSQNHSDKPRRQPNLRCLQTTLTPCGKALQLTQAPFFSFLHNLAATPSKCQTTCLH